MKADKVSYKNLLKMSAENNKAEILEKIEENVSVTSETTIEINDWADDVPDNDIKNDWRDHKSKQN